MNLKVLTIVAIVFAAIASWVSMYELGYEAGQDAQKVMLQDAINKQRKDYDTKLKARIKQFTVDYRESMMNFRAYEKERADKAITRAKLEFEAGEKSNEIISRIPQIKQSDNCNNFNADTYRVYRDTRRIVSDPRSNRDTTSTSDADTTN